MDRWAGRLGALTLPPPPPPKGPPPPPPRPPPTKHRGRHRFPGRPRSAQSTAGLQTRGTSSPSLCPAGAAVMSIPGEKLKKKQEQVKRGQVPSLWRAGVGWGGEPKAPPPEQWRGRGLHSPARLRSLASCGEKQRKHRLLSRPELPELMLHPAEGQTGRAVAAPLRPRSPEQPCFQGGGL